MAAATTLTLGVISTICSLFGQEQEPVVETGYEMPTALHGRTVSDLRDEISIGGARLVDVSRLQEAERHAMMSLVNNRIAGSALRGSVEMASLDRLLCSAVIDAVPVHPISPRTYRTISLVSPSIPARSVAANRIRRIRIPREMAVSCEESSFRGDLSVMRVALHNLCARLGGAGNDITGSLPTSRIKLYLRQSERALKNLPR